MPHVSMLKVWAAPWLSRSLPTWLPALQNLSANFCEGLLLVLEEFAAVGHSLASLSVNAYLRQTEGDALCASLRGHTGLHSLCIEPVVCTLTQLPASLTRLVLRSRIEGEERAFLHWRCLLADVLAVDQLSSRDHLRLECPA